MDTEYNFPVELQPIFLSSGKQIEDRKAVVRTDTMKALGIVSNEYGLVKHATVIDAFREAGKEFGVKEKISLVKDGAYLFYQMTFPKVEMEVAKGDIVRMQMIARNSYNGMNALQIVFGALRLVCLNGMVMASQFLQFQYRHIGDVGGMNNMMIVDQYKEAYTNYIRLFGERMPEIRAMSRKLLIQTGKEFEKDSVVLPDYLRKDAKNGFEAGNDKTVWGYYNSLTFAITHGMRKESPALAIAYGREAWRVAEKLIN